MQQVEQRPLRLVTRVARSRPAAHGTYVRRAAGQTASRPSAISVASARSRAAIPRSPHLQKCTAEHLTAS